MPLRRLVGLDGGGHWPLVRIQVVIIILLLAAPVASHALAADPSTTGVELDDVHDRAGVREADELTVATTHFGDKRQGAVAAFDESGALVYQNSSYTRYFDVDPVEGTEATVLYVAQQNLPRSHCDIPAGSELICFRQVFEQVNLSTGAVERVYTEIVLTARKPDSWHDVDRVGEDRYLVADFFDHRAFIVDVETGLITWEWRATTDYNLTSGGENKADWTHLNDVESIRGGDVVMVSLRNHDQVAFIHRERGLLENWTLGADDRHGTLYEQHNPDYIPASRGGPAVLVADSENNRIVEYRRQNEEWVLAWEWTDERMQWPRDADRLPNGHTLIADTHSDRLLELDRDGQVVWSTTFPKPYDVERLGTGDESAGGPAHTFDWLGNRTVTNASAASQSSGMVQTAVTDMIPNKMAHGLLWVAPAWMTVFDAVLSALAVLLLVGLMAVELYRSEFVQFSWPVRYRRR